ncbi:AAA family ATPase [Rudaeicoccus suwonensis]
MPTADVAQPTGWPVPDTSSSAQPVGWRPVATAPISRVVATIEVATSPASAGVVSRETSAQQGAGSTQHSDAPQPTADADSSSAATSGSRPAPAEATGASGDVAPAAPVEAASSPPAPRAQATTSDSPLAEALMRENERRRRVEQTQIHRPAVPRVMTVANQKGGVGKTTTTVNIAAALAQAGLRVLVIDIDPQGNASTALGIDHHADVPSIYDVVVEGAALATVVQECPDVPGLWCAPATIDLAGAEIELVSLVARESRLKRAIDAFQQDAGPDQLFDYVLVDCPPSLGLLTVNAFVAATEVFIPIQCEYYALEGLSQLLTNIELIRAHLNPTLHVSTILMTMYDARTRLSSQVADEVRAHFPNEVLKVSVPRSVRISEAPSHGQTVLTYDPSSSGALSYLEAAKELALRASS